MCNLYSITTIQAESQGAPNQTSRSGANGLTNMMLLGTPLSFPYRRTSWQIREYCAASIRSISRSLITNSAELDGAPR